jgi:L-aspartate oxidase
MHGANRLASNSLLEGLVVGGRAGKAAARHAAAVGRTHPVAGEPAPSVALDRGDLQRAMTRDASVVRDAAGLHRLIDTLATATDRRLGSRADCEDIALTLTARAVAAAALDRAESRGSHHRADFPDTDPGQGVSTAVRLRADGQLAVTQPAATCVS